LTTPGRRFGLRQGLVVTQVAVSVVLLVGGLLLTRSLIAALDTDPGFAPKGLVAATISMDMHGYDEARAKQFFERATEQTRLLPGVQSVTTVDRLPFSKHPPRLPDAARGDAAAGLSVDTTRSHPILDTLGVPHRRRRFDTRDTCRPRAAFSSERASAAACAINPASPSIGGRAQRVRLARGPLRAIAAPRRPEVPDPHGLRPGRRRCSGERELRAPNRSS
jgi:hypothetical protein